MIYRGTAWGKTININEPVKKRNNTNVEFRAPSWLMAVLRSGDNRPSAKFSHLNDLSLDD